MVYQVKQSAAKQKKNRFEFQMPGSKKLYSVPLLQYIPPRLVIDLQKVDDSKPDTVIDFIQKLFKAVSPKEDILALFDDEDQFTDWFVAWQEASTVQLGESSASAASSRSAGAHSAGISPTTD
jgi:hypothetical protein